MRVALLDTTVQGSPGSMTRYREQLQKALESHTGDKLDAEVHYLGVKQETFLKIPARLRMWMHHLQCRRKAKSARLKDYDVVHLLDGSFGYVADCVRHDRVIVTVHDIIPRLQADGFFPNAPPVGRGARFVIERALRGVKGCAMIASDSESTARDLRRFDAVPDGGIEVVPLAVETELFQGEEATECGFAPFKGGYLFHLGNNGFYKNRLGAVEVLASLPEKLSDVGLVLAGPPASPEINARISEHGLKERIHFESFPDQHRLIQLYRGAAALVFPSVYEGFGWPPLEAMTVGCPVVCSDAGSLAEVVLDAAVTCESGDYDGMADGCTRILSDATFRQSMIEKGRQRASEFSLEKLSSAMADVYRRVTHE